MTDFRKCSILFIVSQSKTSEGVDTNINALAVAESFGEMNMQILQDAQSQVKPMLSHKDALVQKLAQAIQSKSTKQVIEVSGQKFNFEFKQGAGGEKNGYIIKTTYRPHVEVASVKTVGTGYVAHATLDSALRSSAKYSTRSIASNVVLEVEYGISSSMSANIVHVNGWQGEVEAYALKVAKELNWN